MLGAIVGDVIGSVYEGHPPFTEDFALLHPVARPTDDSFHTLAIAEVLLDGGSYTESLRRWSRANPDGGYGGRFFLWMHSDRSEPYGSYGNGAAMRVSPAAWAHDSLEAVLDEARRTAEVTHDHPEGIRGAQATAGAIFVARTGGSRDDLRALVEGRFGYDASRSLERMRRESRFDETCQGTVPVAMSVALLSTSFEDAVRKAVSLGGDADTLGCITGSVAEALYGGVPREIAVQVLARLESGHRALVERFMRRHRIPLG